MSRAEHDSTVPRAYDAAKRPPPGLPSDPAVFWSVAVNLDEIGPRPEAPSSPVLPRLGPPPFPRGGFPLSGFLATVYEHVAQSAGRGTRAPSETRS